MKKLLYILFFISIGINAQVNMWTYDTANGGNNNGTIEQSEFQAALDNEASLTISPSTTITVTSIVSLDQIAVQTVDFNGTVIEKNFTSDYALYINKAGMSGTNTTLTDFEIDGNDNHGSLMYINSRTQLTNAEIHHAQESATVPGGPRGIYISVTNNIGVQGEWVLDNVDIHDITNTYRRGIPQQINPSGTGAAQGLQINWPVTVSGSGMQFVYKDSEIYNIWGDEADGIIVNSPAHDISNTNNTLWFERMTLRECERRALKGYIGNQTWIDSDIYATDRTNPNIDTRSSPGGLFNIGAGSSAAASENNLVCGVRFHGGPTTPLDSWETMINIGGTGGETEVEFRNCTFDDMDDLNTSWGNNATYDWSGINLTFEISGFKICNSDFGNASVTSRSKMNKGSGFTLTGSAMEIDSNNTYDDGQTQFLTDFTVTTDYVVSDLSGDCAACPSYGGAPTTDITGIKFTTSTDNTIHINENTVDPSAVMEPITDETGETYSYALTGAGLDPSMFTVGNDTLYLDNGSTFTPDFEDPQDSNTNNIYAAVVRVTSTSGDTYDENMVFFIDDVVEGGEVYVTAIEFDDDSQTILVGEFVDKSHTFTPASPDNTGVSYYSGEADTPIIGTDGLGLHKGTTTYHILADDTENGTITDSMSVTVNADSWKESKVGTGIAKTSGGTGKIQIGK